MTHSPAPWHAINFANYWNIHDEPYYEGKDLLNEEDCTNAEANAKLAVCAPELLEALINISEHLKTVGEWNKNLPIDYINQAEAVIKKAKGE